jgi:tagatose 6-phosphate kinase
LIIVLSVNTAIDRVLQVPVFTPGTVMRATETRTFAGGKGINVARNLRKLGDQVRVVGFLGGFAAAFIKERCSELGLDARWVDIAGETRTCITCLDSATGRQTVLNEPGPPVTSHEVDRLLEVLPASVSPGDLLCISGTAPPGMPAAAYGEIVQMMKELGLRVLVDAGGPGLHSAIRAGAWAVSPNEEELRSATKLGGASAAEIAHKVAEEIDIVLVTMGRNGCILGAHGGLWRASAPEIHELNAVGSGDAFVAGFLSATANGVEPVEAIRLAVACGASNALRYEPWIGSRQEIETLQRQVKIEMLALPA